ERRTVAAGVQGENSVPFIRTFIRTPSAELRVSGPVGPGSVARVTEYRGRRSSVRHPYPSKEEAVTHRYSIAGAFAALLLALGVFAPPVHAQTGKITGLVTDQQSGEPLAGVQVTIAELRRSTITGENGRYFMINIPPGTYTVVAQVIGYATVRKENITVTIDVTRTVDFELPSEALAVTGVVVEVERIPLIETSSAGSATTLTTAEVNALPVTSVEGALALKQGFLQVPQNTDIIAFTDTRRNAIEPLQIRGGRVGETSTLIDGIPVNNFVFGGPAITVNRKYVQQIEYQRGGLEP